ncbi:hypothetical protein CXZ10_17590 [Pleomorphomonas diazotrophica]|uniref:Transcriptional regulator AbiEi antitoxin N-terminal domain-containing protein n=1 Tax=Pleomorphomonas diazotrophica TaxID=1166257 RepID=A0A1I4W8F7_9HYPH|nr:type IV toxin-antitoxin system AbiEi family antitoxin domain-containing protein [Pleomorphomonas diazotrophica]PKR87937.1 hypothetical protein CXZ10_17590 [Pleomorphomonas diazotrophica]SFN09550.1 transcriptional regulator with AbiEi antitoxin N-terminal domain [Pleomorphomonas diazotrophica]
MAEQSASLLNQLAKDLPEGLVVDAAWLDEHGIASNLRAYYVRAGWLEQPVRGVYKKPRGELRWQQVVISLQTLLLRSAFIVGGRTALELQGFAHYLAQETKAVYLYGREKPPTWLQKLDLPQRFVYRNSTALFRNDPVAYGIDSLRWGQWDWPLTLSRPERAYLEMLDELPRHESFHQADMIMQGAANFSPRRLQKLLVDCRSIKVKRLFFFFADRHRHAWLKHLDKAVIDLGKGKRALVPGGRLDPVYLITVPGDLDAVS